VCQSLHHPFHGAQQPSGDDKSCKPEWQLERQTDQQSGLESGMEGETLDMHDALSQLGCEKPGSGKDDKHGR